MFNVSERGLSGVAPLWGTPSDGCISIRCTTFEWRAGWPKWGTNGAPMGLQWGGIEKQNYAMSAMLEVFLWKTY